MAATNYSPIQLYYSTTASAAPAAGNLVSGELAINITDGKLYYKDNAGAVQLLSTSTTANGTANGVLYLNGSKVATSGSALTFDGTNFSATGTTTVNSANSTAVALVVKGETGNGIRQRFIGQASSGQYNWQIGASITAAGEFSFMPSTAADGTTFTSSVYNITPTGVSYWSVGGSEQMRLTSTGLGIGTSSPSYKLDVNAGTSGIYANFNSTNASGGFLRLTNSGTVMGLIGAGAQIGAGNASDLNITSANNLIFGYNGGTRGMTLDTSGNLGLGVTPSAWNAGKALQIAGTGLSGSVFMSDTGVLMFSNNYRYSSGDIYAANGYATRYYQYAGQHVWNTAPSGTAGNAITFTQAATLTANGDYLIGTTTTASSNSNLKKIVGGDHRSFAASATVPALGTSTVLTLNSSIAGTYIISASFGSQGNEIYGGMAIVVANGGSFRIVLNGSGARCTITLSGANVQITNALGVQLDATVSATYFGAELGS